MNLLPRRKTPDPDPDLAKTQQDLNETQRRLQNLKETVKVWKRKTDGGGTNSDHQPG